MKRFGRVLLLTLGLAGAAMALVLGSTGRMRSVNADSSRVADDRGAAGSDENRLDREDHPVLVRDVDNQPFESFVCTTQTNRFETCSAGGDTVTVPNTTSSGETVKALVIDYVSGFCAADPGQDVVNVTLIIPVGGFAHFFVPVRAATSDTTQLDYAIAQQTRIYAGAGQTVRIGAAHKVGGSGSYFCLLQFTGHFITK